MFIREKGSLWRYIQNTYRLHMITYRSHMTTYNYIQITYVYVITFVMSAMGYISTIRITCRLHREDRLPVYMLYVAYVAICSIYAI